MVLVAEIEDLEQKWLLRRNSRSSYPLAEKGIKRLRDDDGHVERLWLQSRREGPPDGVVQLHTATRILKLTLYTDA